MPALRWAGGPWSNPGKGCAGKNDDGDGMASAGTPGMGTLGAPTPSNVWRSAGRGGSGADGAPKGANSGRPVGKGGCGVGKVVPAGIAIGRDRRATPCCAADGGGVTARDAVERLGGGKGTGRTGGVWPMPITV